MNNLKLLQKQHIMKRFILLLFSFLITFSLNYSFAVGGGGGGSDDFVNPPPGIPACSGLDAPSQTACTATEICDMHGYCGTTSSSYTVDTWSNLTSAFCGSIENNSFLTFTAEEPSITIDVYVYGCNDNEAIQVFLFEANNCSGGPVTGIECGNEMYAQDTPYTLSANGLVPGNDYYIMIDGYAGDVCDYSFVAGEGISMPVNVDISDSTVCMGETLTVTASGGDGSYTWESSPDLSSTTEATVTITPPTTPGVYTYNVHSTSTSNCGEDPSVATVTVTVDNCGCPVLVSNSGPICEGELFDLEADILGNITSFIWEGPNGFTSTEQNPTGITPPLNPGFYEYVFTATIDGVECEAITTLVVEGIPVADAGNDMAICEGDSVVLSGSGGGTWDNGVNDGIAFAPSSTQVYTSTVTENGCTDSDQVEVIVNPIPNSVFEGNELIGCAPHTVTFTNNPEVTNANCTWDFGDGTISNVCDTITHTYLDSGVYDVTLTVESEGCESSTTLSNYIEVFDMPVADFTADTTVTDFHNTEIYFTNQSSNATDYLWDFGDGSPQVTDEHPFHIYPYGVIDNYNVTLLVTNDIGCTDTASLTISVIYLDMEYEIPNVFTPNGDGRNDFFKLTNAMHIESFEVIILNRWGTVVFESNDVNFNWNGKKDNSGIECSTGTYFYKMNFKAFNGEEKKEHGFVHLAR